MRLTAELSLYPLRQQDLMPPIDAFVRRLREAGLEVDFGPMSTTVAGDADTLFDTVRDAFREASVTGAHALMMKVTNAAPSPADAR